MLSKAISVFGLSAIFVFHKTAGMNSDYSWILHPLGGLFLAMLAASCFKKMPVWGLMVFVVVVAVGWEIFEYYYYQHGTGKMITRDGWKDIGYGVLGGGLFVILSVILKTALSSFTKS